MTTLGGIWNGEKHLLEPGEHFPEEGAYLVVVGWEEQEEEDVLSPFESATVEPILKHTQTYPDDPRFPNRNVEQAWGSLSVALGAFAEIAGIRREQYQENRHDNKTVTRMWTFQAKQELGERI